MKRRYKVEDLLEQYFTLGRQVDEWKEFEKKLDAQREQLEKIEARLKGESK